MVHQYLSVHRGIHRFGNFRAHKIQHLFPQLLSVGVISGFLRRLSLYVSCVTYNDLIGMNLHVSCVTYNDPIEKLYG